MGQKLQDNEAMKKALKEDGRWQEFCEIRKKNLDSRNLLPGAKKREIWRNMGYDCFGGKLNESRQGSGEGVSKTGKDKVGKARPSVVPEARPDIPPPVEGKAVTELIKNAGVKTSIDDVQWIYLNLRSKNQVYTQPPPNGGAEALLHYIQSNGSLMTEFVRSLFRKMDADRAREKNLGDDGRIALNRVESLLIQFKQREKK